MGTFADSLFSVLMSWVRALVNGIWALFTSDHTTLLEFLGKNWLLIAVALMIAGLVIDWLVWLVRWQPYHIWAQRVRRLLRLTDEEEDEPPVRKKSAPDKSKKKAEAENWLDEDDAWLPLAAPQPSEREAQEAISRAQSVPDEELGAYPGMRYDQQAAAVREDMSGTRRYAAVHSEGPGAAEVSRRRAEIDAWQQQMQEEAQNRAAAERAAREAEQARIAYETEQARLAQEAYEAEQARIAYEAEQSRLAQEQYERELAEYERRKAQYELELAEYERQKAAYDAEMARIAAQQEAAQELAPGTDAAPSRRRRAVKATYSDYVQGEHVSELPDAPAWPKMESAQTPLPAKESKISKMARLFEPEHEEIMGVTALPPRVDMKDAYRPAKKPQGAKKRGS